MPKIKTVTGEAARKANVEKARAMLAPKPIIATTNAEAAKVSDVPVVQEKPKGTAKKPTAKELGVSGLVGNRGKTRSENPAPLVAPEVKLCEVFAELTAHHTAYDPTYAMVRVLETKTGKPWYEHAEKGESLEHLLVRAVKTLSAPAKVVDAPTFTRTETAAEILLAGPRVTAPTAPKPVTVSKPRGEGWNGMSGSAIFRWAGSVGWSKEEAVKCLNALGLTGLQEKSLPTLLKAGKDGFRVGTMPAEHAKALEIMAGRAHEEDKPANIAVKPRAKK